MPFERGDLLLVPFPFTDLSAAKRRPVLLLTRPDGYGDFIALPITSRLRVDHGVALTAADLATGVLPRASWVRTDRVVTLNVSLVVRSVARVSEPVVAAAVAQLCAYLARPSAV